ncbi:MAG: 16S rRNA (cytidine(1402)-2'-O)-methyltransferase [Chloroflexota bacterium]|nr:MAG: 16S rRNA (cytidine(1402)-2'-O)-methyltransferase [Chloroflexota bacterium]
MSDLYLVATPIGNLEDMSFRAVRILKEVPLIAAEDTRTSAKLLKHYQIGTPLTSYHDHNKSTKTEVLINHLDEADLALVSDAGTPAINDPGFILVQAALAAGHRIVPVPGPSAPIAALSAAGLPTDNFLYLGYLPRKKKARQDLLILVKDLPWTLVFLETPHRLLNALEDCLSILGDRQIAVARELTKLHEEIKRGRIDQIRDYYTKKKPKGEITLIIGGKEKEQVWDQNRLHKVIREEIGQEGISPSQLAKRLAKESGWSRKDIYDLMQDLQE